MDINTIIAHYAAKAAILEAELEQAKKVIEDLQKEKEEVSSDD